MTTRGPHATLVELPGVGHAPTLVAPDQVAVVSDFLRQGAVQA
jgi:pimeloyl-ACP methyl ester carboxylesterase